MLRLYRSGLGTYLVCLVVCAFCIVFVICCLTVRLFYQLFVVVTVYVHIYSYSEIAKFRIILFVLLLLLI